MRPDVVVLFEPLIDDGLGLSCCCEPFSVKHFTTQRSVEAFVVAILPGRAGIDVDGLDTDLDEPFLKGSDVNSGPLSDLRYSGFPYLSSNG